MTFGEFIKAIINSGITNDGQARIVVDIFTYAGAYKGKYTDGSVKEQVISDSTANAWINGKRTPKTSKYFPHGKINNEAGFISYFRIGR